MCRKIIQPDDMSDPSGEKSKKRPGSNKGQLNDAKQALRRSLSGFLTPGFPIQPKQTPDPNGAAHLRMAQMELANRMRLQKEPDTDKAGKDQKKEIEESKKTPMPADKLPPSAKKSSVPKQKILRKRNTIKKRSDLKKRNVVQKRNTVPKAPPPGGFGAFHLQRPNFGQNNSPKPTASRPSPYQQVFANAHKKEEKPEEPKDESEEVIEIPQDAEFKQNEKPKRLKGKKFRNPSL